MMDFSEGSAQMAPFAADDAGCWSCLWDPFGCSQCAPLVARETSDDLAELWAEALAAAPSVMTPPAAIQRRGGDDASKAWLSFDPEIGGGIICRWLSLCTECGGI